MHKKRIDLVTQLRDELIQLETPNPHEREAIIKSSLLLRCLNQAQATRDQAARAQLDVDAQIAAVAKPAGE